MAQIGVKMPDWVNSAIWFLRKILSNDSRQMKFIKGTISLPDTNIKLKVREIAMALLQSIIQCNGIVWDFVAFYILHSVTLNIWPIAWKHYLPRLTVVIMVGAARRELVIIIMVITIFNRQPPSSFPRSLEMPHCAVRHIGVRSRQHNPLQNITELVSTLCVHYTLMQ